MAVDLPRPVGCPHRAVQRGAACLPRRRPAGRPQSRSVYVESGRRPSTKRSPGSHACPVEGDDHRLAHPHRRAQHRSAARVRFGRRLAAAAAADLWGCPRTTFCSRERPRPLPPVVARRIGSRWWRGGGTLVIAGDRCSGCGPVHRRFDPASFQAHSTSGATCPRSQPSRRGGHPQRTNSGTRPTAPTTSVATAWRASSGRRWTVRGREQAPSPARPLRFERQSAPRSRQRSGTSARVRGSDVPSSSPV